jgi:pantoate--beta-alanine ligase
MKPLVIADIAPLRHAVAEARRRGQKIGLVPTMGALHAGHLSLIEAARAQTGYVVVSIFVNPTQFGPNEDLKRYPRPLEHDLELCHEAGVDVVFHPQPAIVYPPDYRTFVEVTGLQDVLCGASRPGHFRGVATVVLKLLNLVQPDCVYFGQKDAQQVRIIAQMVRDLNVPVQVCVCPIVREADGLALSSRNEYLEAEERRGAVVLHQSLLAARRRIEAGERDAAAVQQAMAEQIASAAGAKLDYAAVVDAGTLQLLDRIAPDRPVLLAVAVRFGGTRLIDNLLIPVSRDPKGSAG